jgi:hypothetical protein
VQYRYGFPQTWIRRGPVKKVLAVALYTSAALNFFPGLIVETKLLAGTKTRSPIDPTGS